MMKKESTYRTQKNCLIYPTTSTASMGNSLDSTKLNVLAVRKHRVVYTFVDP